MQITDAQNIIETAIGIVDEMSPRATDGTWLEDLTVIAGPHIKEWDIDECYSWSAWPEREDYFPNRTKQDVGIDAVGFRRDDNQYIAIQCKARKLDEHGNGDPISKSETDKFGRASAEKFWAERWIVTNGAVAWSDKALKADSMAGQDTSDIKLVNITDDLLYEQQGALGEEECPHCANPDDKELRQNQILHAGRSGRDKRAASQAARAIVERRTAGGSGSRQNHPALRHREDPHLAAHR